MQIYADVTGRPIKISGSSQSCALGAAIAGAVVAGEKRGGYGDFLQAQDAMTGLKKKGFNPNPKAHDVYREIYTCYKKLHDAFGTTEWRGNLFDVMKRMLEIRTKGRLRISRPTISGLCGVEAG
jgi:L-ribulokinase